MLALRLTRAARLAVQLRRLLVAVASAGTGFLLLCALGHAMTHPDTPGASALRLTWCAAPLAATVYLAVAVARTDPGTRPRPGLSAIGLGPGRLMAVSATTTALTCALGSVAALLVFLHLRGDLTGPPYEGAVTDALSAGLPLPFPAALTLLALVPASASAAVALTLRPREPRPAPPTGSRRYGRFGAYGWGAARETFGAYGRYGARLASGAGAGSGAGSNAGAGSGAGSNAGAGSDAAPGSGSGSGPDPSSGSDPGSRSRSAQPADNRAAGAMGVSPLERGRERGGADADGPPAAEGALLTQAGTPRPEAATAVPEPTPDAVPDPPAAPRPQNTATLPWGIAVLTAGLAVETYAGNTAAPSPDGAPSAGVLFGWALTALGLALAGPGLTHLCGRLLQTARPGALRLLAGRVLMAESHRIGRPLGVVCSVASAAYAGSTLYGTDGPDFGPLSLLGALLVGGCTVATLLTAAVEAGHARADTTDALLRLGAPPATLRAAAAVRVGALLALFGPLTLIVAQLAALPLTG
ncbi:hypothetical protein [Streptomyces pactum]|uniref:Uncharacterized protein n=1 Tax=Streptomyces pactum TaxID=68249 RepID=A0A1S6J6E4_9ACTN|nr:hypothetical protein [Streptomyces pactum]AQS67291.1 hypothetical protein B1H29_10445 [Streptomyces pactum]